MRIFKKIVAIFFALLVSLIGGLLISYFVTDVFNNIFFSKDNLWFVIRWFSFGSILGLFVYFRIRTKCPHCGATFAEKHISTETLSSETYSKDVEKTIDGKNRIIREAYSRNTYKSFYRCESCGEEYTSTWSSTKKL